MLAEHNTSGMFTVLLTVDFKFINNFKTKRWKLNYFKCALPHFTQHTLWNFSVLCNRLSINSINSDDFSFLVYGDILWDPLLRLPPVSPASAALLYFLYWSGK